MKQTKEETRESLTLCLLKWCHIVYLDIMSDFVCIIKEFSKKVNGGFGNQRLVKIYTIFIHGQSNKKEVINFKNGGKTQVLIQII